MEDSPHPIEGDSDAGAGPFADFRPVIPQHRFDIGPIDAGPNRIGEDGGKRPLVLGHFDIVSSFDTIGNSASRCLANLPIPR